MVETATNAVQPQTSTGARPDPVVRCDRSGRLQGVLSYSYMEPSDDGAFFSVQTELSEVAAELGVALPRTAAAADAIPGATVRLRSR